MKKKVGVVILLVFGVIGIFDKLIMPFYVSQGSVRVVPDVTEMPYEDAVRKLRHAGFEAKKSYYVKYLSGIDSNVVISQMPEAGLEVKPGRNVYLVLNRRDKPTFPMPDFQGRPEFDARQAAARMELTLEGVQMSPVTNPEDDGKVLSQSVPPQTVVSSGTALSLIIGRYQESSEGLRKVVVPDVLGMSLSQASQVISEAGLNSGKIITEYSAILVPNTVISQKPAVGSYVAPGQQVELTVVTAE
ncbi:PASTA domain-containing protein [Chlorobium ferrooxidans]|uniref:PASTA n=1 Tax=Chlorobium ferrooxidans DSM 13031 TaxID=377431 RepID=Q0YT40_9CHLB|nr:PASTA domain-containing protein [Chlorobium ferrooxidans]EAT59425.1 PASTA [Chlorobium ferrooxidans DSM 13031]